MRTCAAEGGFTLIEVLLATALFVFVAAAGFEVVRALGANVTLIATRADAAEQMRLAAAMLRSDALSAMAVWKPPSACGDAVAFMRRDAGGTSFGIYAQRAGALVRATAAGPLDPCAPDLTLQTLIAHVASISVTRIAATGLPQHTDPVAGTIDGAAFVSAGITRVAADAHARDIDGTPIASGNDVIEVLLDADPVLTPVDLVAGNRPAAYTHVLTYTCNGRCEAGAAFPEIRNAAFDDCTPGYDFQNGAGYYAPATYGFVNAHLVVTSYTVSAAYAFSFDGPAPLTAERAWPLVVWPPATSPLAGTVADAYPVDYANNALAARGIANVAADLGEPAAFARELTACADMHADPVYHG